MFESDASLLLARSGNQAVQVNPPNGLNFHITDHGSDWYWAAFSLFAVSAIGAFAFSLFRNRNERLFYQFATFGLFVLSIQYFTQASDLGWTDIQAEFNHVTTSTETVFPGFRQIFYSRWVGYFLAFPTFLINFATLVGLPWSDALFTVVAQEATIISFLIGSLIHSTYKWGYFTFGVVSFFVVCYSLLFNYRKAAYDNDLLVSKHSIGIASGAVLLLLLYPVAWGLSEGGNVIQLDSEAAFYGVLDVCFFIILNAYFLWVSSKINFEERGIAGFQNRVFATKSYPSLPTNEKVAYPVGANAQIPRSSDETATHQV